MLKPLAGRRVLVVEDEMLVLMSIEDMLTDLGCDKIVAAATVEAALDIIATEALDCATLDLNLAGERTYAVADALAAHNIPFVFSSGYVDHGTTSGYDDRPMLHKPYRTAEFVTTIIRLIAGTPANTPAAPGALAA